MPTAEPVLKRHKGTTSPHELIMEKVQQPKMDQLPPPQKHNPFLNEIPEPPPNLEEMGRRSWNWVCRRLIEDNQLQLKWLAGIQELCQAYDLKAKLSTALEETGFLLVGPTGMPVPNPLLTRIEVAEKNIKQWLIELRLTPRSMTALQTSKERNIAKIELPRSRKALVK